MMELGMLAISCKYLPEERIADNFIASPSLVRTINNISCSGRGALILVPHLSTMEAATMIPKIAAVKCPPMGVIYRPFRNKALEKFIRESRGRFAIELFSRKSGIIEAMRLLQRNGIVAMLFDQNAGCSGYTTTFFDRCTQSTELPGILATKYGVPVYCLYPDRIGPWRAEIKIEKLYQSCKNSVELIVAANKWLEGKLCASESACADWLWAHDRWKITFNNPKILSLNRARSWLPETKRLLGHKVFPKKLKIFVRLPNWLGDVVMAIPVLRTLKSSRPDVELTLLCQPQFIEMLTKLDLAEHFIPLPEKNGRYFFKFFKYRKLYADIHIIFTNSLRGDAEAYIINAPIRLGIDNSHPRPLLTDIFNFGPQFDRSNVHQTKIWGTFLRAYGLKSNVNYTPYKICREVEPDCFSRHSIGMICGSANNPAKRWPVNHWRVLIERILNHYPGIQIGFYGVASDSKLADKIVLGLGKYSVKQLCGTTTLTEFIQSIDGDDLIVSGDTGGMHVASMFGRPLVCIYGPTNSVHTGPIFNGKKTIIYPEGCPLKGGFPIKDVSVDQVFAAITLTMDKIISIPPPSLEDWQVNQL
jgi:ADP-heptose:LPS heptosyltransferase